MGRRVVTSVYLDEDLTKEARLIAEKLGYSLSKLVEEMLANAIGLYQMAAERDRTRLGRRMRLASSGAATLLSLAELKAPLTILNCGGGQEGGENPD